MEYRIFVNNMWREKSIVLYDETGDAAVIDCGCVSMEEEDRLRSFLSRKGLKQVVLLNTHLHPDHVFGNRFMKEEYGLETQASKDDEFLIDHAVEYAAMLGMSDVTPPPRIGKYLKDGDSVSFGNSVLQVIAIPGHSPGGLCYYAAADRLLISGDVLFAGSVGRADLPGGDERKLIQGIKDRLLVLSDDVCVIPGHGSMTTIGEERRYNPFLR